MQKKIKCKMYTIYKATLYLKIILLKNVFLKRSVLIAGIAGDLFLKLYLVVLISGKLALRGWFGILEQEYPTNPLLKISAPQAKNFLASN